MTWFLLSVAIVFEVAGTTSMKLAEGFTRPIPSVLIFVFYAAAFVLLVFVLKRLDLGVTYAIWAGLGTALVVVVSILWFGEPVTLVKLISFILIMVGVVGLNLGEAGHP